MSTLTTQALPPKDENPQLDLINNPFYVNAELAEWPINGKVKSAGFNSASLGSINAYCFNEKKQPRRKGKNRLPWEIIYNNGKSTNHNLMQRRHFVSTFLGAKW